MKDDRGSGNTLRHRAWLTGTKLYRLVFFYVFSLFFFLFFGPFIIIIIIPRPKNHRRLLTGRAWVEDEKKDLKFLRICAAGYRFHAEVVNEDVAKEANVTKVGMIFWFWNSVHRLLAHPDCKCINVNTWKNQSKIACTVIELAYYYSWFRIEKKTSNSR